MDDRGALGRAGSARVPAVDLTDLWRGSPVAPRAWQVEALPVVLDGLKRKRAGLVVATMGAGKSRLQAQVARLALSKTMERGHRIVFLAPRQRLVRQLAATVGEHCGRNAVGMYFAGKKQSERPIIVCCAASLPALRAELEGAGVKVSLLVVDEAHNSESEVQLTEIPKLNPVCMVGFTATPFRSVPKESLSLWEGVSYRYTMADALRDGVLVPLRVVRWEGGDHEELDRACLAMMREHTAGPGIVSARSIADAQEHAAWLTGERFPAGAIHSGMGDREQATALSALERGTAAALVHVALLAEGVDLPWLRWLCARRKVGAAVRHFQEFGRVMRTHPGKREAVLLDPHLLMGRFGEYPAEAIGTAWEEAAEAEVREPAARGAVGMTEEQAVAFDLLIAHLEDVRRDLEGAQIIEPRKVDGGGWELADVSQKQVDAIATARKLTRYIPQPHRESIKVLARVPYAMTRGQAGLLLDVLYGGARWCGREADRLELPDRKRWTMTWAAGVVSAKAPAVEDVRAASGKKARKAVET